LANANDTSKESLKKYIVNDIYRVNHIKFDDKKYGRLDTEKHFIQKWNNFERNVF